MLIMTLQGKGTDVSNMPYVSVYNTQAVDYDSISI
jgi:hypothetical protein